MIRAGLSRTKLVYLTVRIAILLTCIVSVSCSPTKQSSVRPEATSTTTIKGGQVVIYALGLIGIDYRFGGKNPESGLDCSGMVAYIYKNAIGLSVPANAQQIANVARPIEAAELLPGDLVFFNTLNRAFSHVGIYIGDDRFVHSPGTSGKIKISSLKSKYYAHAFHAAATLLH